MVEDQDDIFEKCRKRARLNEGSLERSIDEVWDKVQFRIKEKTDRTYASKHEILGIIEEEKYELLKAIHENGPKEDLIEELKDIAVACLFGIASLHSDTVDW